MSINKVILVGNLGSDPDIRTSDKNKPFCNLNIATNHTFTDASDQRQNRTEWHQVVCFGATAETCARYLKKGRQVYVEGRIESQRWLDKEGKERITNRVVANIVQFLGTKPTGDLSAIGDAAASALSDAAFSADEDIPW